MVSQREIGAFSVITNLRMELFQALIVRWMINVTAKYGPINIVQPIFGIILPALIFITLIFNSLIILVLTR